MLSQPIVVSAPDQYARINCRCLVTMCFRANCWFGSVYSKQYNGLGTESDSIDTKQGDSGFVIKGVGEEQSRMGPPCPDIDERRCSEAGETAHDKALVASLAAAFDQLAFFQLVSLAIPHLTTAKTFVFASPNMDKPNFLIFFQMNSSKNRIVIAPLYTRDKNHPHIPDPLRFEEIAAELIPAKDGSGLTLLNWKGSRTPGKLFDLLTQPGEEKTAGQISLFDGYYDVSQYLDYHTVTRGRINLGEATLSVRSKLTVVRQSEGWQSVGERARDAVAKAAGRAVTTIAPAAAKAAGRAVTTIAPAAAKAAGRAVTPVARAGFQGVATIGRTLQSYRGAVRDAGGLIAEA
jgi:hypothetical protein